MKIRIFTRPPRLMERKGKKIRSPNFWYFHAFFLVLYSHPRQCIYTSTLGRQVSGVHGAFDDFNFSWWVRWLFFTLHATRLGGNYKVWGKKATNFRMPCTKHPPPDPPNGAWSELINKILLATRSIVSITTTHKPNSNNFACSVDQTIYTGPYIILSFPGARVLSAVIDYGHYRGWWWLWCMYLLLTTLIQFEMDEWMGDSSIESGFSSDMESISSATYHFREQNGRKSVRFNFVLF